MTRNEKIIGGLALLWALSGNTGNKKKASPKTSQAPPAPAPKGKTESPPSPGRPPAPKPPKAPKGEEEEPTSQPTAEEPDIDDPTVTVRQRLKMEQEQAAAKEKAKQKGKQHTPTAKQKPKAKRRTKEQQRKVNDQALKLAEDMHDFYLERGQLPQVAAADALTLYLLAGGQDRTQIKGYQKLIGVEPTGEYDNSTREQVITLLDPAVDRATSAYVVLIEKGEDPRYTAAEALATYIIEQRKEPDTIPLVAERVAALQMQFMAVPSGQYDENTKNALVQFGVVPP